MSFDTSVKYENNIHIVKEIKFMEDWFVKNISDNNIIHVSFTHVSLEKKFIHVISSDTEWLNFFWNYNLDLLINDRISNKCSYWSNLGAPYINFFKYISNYSEITDLCVKHQNNFNILSIHSKEMISFNDQALFLSLLPSLTYHTHKMRKNNKYNFKGLTDTTLYRIQNRILDIDLNDDYELQEKRYRFNDVTLTKLELTYLKYLCSWMSQKEIAYRQQVSETAVRKVLSNVKRKFGHEAMPNSKLFKILKKYGVTLAFLNDFMS